MSTSHGPVRAYFYTPPGDLVGFDPNRPARQRAEHYRTESDFRKIAFQLMDPVVNRTISNYVALPGDRRRQADLFVDDYLMHTPLWRDLDDPRTERNTR